MELRHVKYFLAVAEELHFGRAARRLHISQPPLSQQIKALEDELGARLFERTKHRVKLTQAGEAMRIEAYRLLEQADRVRNAVQMPGNGIEEHLDIGFVSSAIFGILPRLMELLQKRRPEIRPTLRGQETYAALGALMDGKLHFGFIRVDKVSAPLKLKLVMRDHFIVALPEGHGLARYRKVPIKRLATTPLAIYSREVSRRPFDAIVAACHKAGFNPNFAHQGPSIESQIGIVACGLGVALVPSQIRNWRIPGVVYRELD